MIPASGPATQLIVATPAADAQSQFWIAIRALRGTTLRVIADNGTATDVSLDAGAERRFTASRELSIAPSDPSAAQWSGQGLTPRPLTGPTTFTRDVPPGATP